jgi:MerR family mercuric resistance operon transcriptional regulator
LLPVPARSSGGYRVYDTGHLKQLTFVRRARALGFSIGEVRTLLRLADERKRPCGEVRVVAAAHLKEVRARIEDLRRMERVLKATVARCASNQRTHCPVIEALYRNGSVHARTSPLRSDVARRRHDEVGDRCQGTQDRFCEQNWDVAGLRRCPAEGRASCEGSRACARCMIFTCGRSHRARRR